MNFTGNFVDDIFLFIKWFFEFVFLLPFSVPFFGFPFTYGHLIWGSITISVSVYVIRMILKGEKGFKNDR